MVEGYQVGETKNSAGILPIEKRLHLDSNEFFDFSYTIEFDERLPFTDWQFRGQGVAYDSCGKEIFKGCLNTACHPEGKAYVEMHRNNCKRSTCPICYEKWLVDTTKNISRRIEAVRPKTGRNRFPVHVTVSVPKNEYNRVIELDGFRKLRRKANSIVLNSGFLGGCGIFHLMRSKCGICGANFEFKVKKCSKCGSTLKIWYISPHFHYLGYGWIKNTKEIYEKTGWIVKNLGKRKSISATAYYQLSHASIRSGIQTVSWIGIASWNKLRLEKERAEKLECPYCGYSLRRLTYYEFGSIPKLEMIKAFKDGLKDSSNWRFLKS